MRTADAHTAETRGEAKGKRERVRDVGSGQPKTRRRGIENVGEVNARVLPIRTQRLTHLWDVRATAYGRTR